MQITREEAQKQLDSATQYAIDENHSKSMFSGRAKNIQDEIFDHMEHLEAEKTRQHLQINEISVKLVDSEFKNKELEAKLAEYEENIPNPDSTTLISWCKEDFEREDKNNDLNYKSFSRGFNSAFLNGDISKTHVNYFIEKATDEDIITSGDVGKGVGYIDGHAWIGRVKANTKYRILVIEEK